MPEQPSIKIADITTIPFPIDKFGLYSITIIARAQSAKQDLRVEIDTLKFREIPPKDKPQYNNIPPAWNGTELKGLAKTIIFILKLNKGEHTLKFIPTQEAIIEKYTVQSISDSQNIEFNLRMQAEDGDRRPWLTFVLIDLSIKTIMADVSTQWHFLDGDDVKLIVDNTIKTNSQSIFHKNWVWSASILRKFFGTEREEKIFTENLKQGVHYIEFWADRIPMLHQVNIDLGEVDLKRIPTVDDPEWTGKFEDDTEEMLLARAIYGEAGGENRDAKIAMAWAIRNRVEDKKNRWGKTYHDVILADFQYEPFINPNGDPFKKITKPLLGDLLENKAWQESYRVAEAVFSGKESDSTKGANHFYVPSDQPKQDWVDEKKLTVQIGATRFYKL